MHYLNIDKMNIKVFASFKKFKQESFVDIVQKLLD